MRLLASQTVFCVSLVSALISCTAPAVRPSRPSHFAPPGDSATQTSRKPPKGDLDFSAGDPYPEQGKRQDLTGRVLVEFQINQRGEAISEKVLGADADPVLQDGALSMVKRMKFDVSGLEFDSADSTPFRVTVLFCLHNCIGLAPFLGTELLVVSPPGVLQAPSIGIRAE